MPEAPATPPARRGDRLFEIAGQVAVGAGVLVLWEFAEPVFGANPYWLSKPSLIAARLLETLAEGTLLPHLWLTLYETLAGLMLGCVLGFGVGAVMGRSRFLRELLEPFLLLLNALPKVAIAPLFMIWFGVGVAMKVAVAFSLVVIVMAISTYSGMRQVRQDLVSLARLMGATRLQVFTKVVLPSIVPWLVAGFKVSMGFALIGAILGEFIAAQRGVGFLIDEGVGLNDSTVVFLGLTVLLVLSWVMNAAGNLLARRLKVGGVALDEYRVF